MSILWTAVLLVALQRLAEMLYARANTRRLMSQGAIELGVGHYPLIVTLHSAWLAALLLLVPADTAPDWRLLGCYLALQPVRLWVLCSLGRYWTTRIITLPGAPLVKRGPYRLLRHPNYLVVVLEIALLPLAFGAWQIAAVFSLSNAALLFHRIRVENAGLFNRAGVDRALPHQLDR